MKSRKEAINAMCRECIYDPVGGIGNWRQQVEACSCPKCPLFDLRPVSVPHTTKKAGKTDTGSEMAIKATLVR